MRALRARLLLALGSVLFLAWAGWFAFQYVQLTVRQGGEVDGMLHGVVDQLLPSLPADIATAGQQQPLVADGAAGPAASGKFAALAFQVWDKANRRRLMSSRTAPDHPLMPEFADGFSDTTLGGEAWRVFAASDTERRVQVQVGLPRAALRSELMRWLAPSLGMALLLLAGIGVAIWAVIHWSLRPVLQLSRSLEKRAPLDLAALDERQLPAEFIPLVRSFNQLMSRLEQALLHERQFLGEAAHELRTPLAALLAQAQVLQHAASPEEANEALDRLVAGIERASRLAQQLLDAARVESGSSATRASDLDLAVVVAMVADEFEIIAQRGGQVVEVSGVPTPVHGDIDDLGIMVRNLLDNALRHGSRGTRVRLQTRISLDASGPVATLIVEDDGPGIAEEERGQVFERFYRAGAGQRAPGAGMGLSLVARVVASHGGQLKCGAGIGGQGFGVQITLPGRPAVPATGAVTRVDEPLPRRTQPAEDWPRSM